VTDARVRASEARQRIGTGALGLVYVLHFDRPVLFTRGGRTVEVRHYIGWSRSVAMLRRRLAHHADGQGARLLAAASAAGITWTRAATFHQADRHFERYLHASKRTPAWCPCCARERAERRPHVRVRRLRTILRLARMA
jgi:hypothetical protein